MAILINAYCTDRDPAPLDFPHELKSRRDRNDPDLAQHLEGFVGYVLSRGNGEMTKVRYHVVAHIKRAQHQFSLDVEEADLDAFSRWAWAANAICFLPDGTVADPSGVPLVDPTTGEPHEGAELPYPADARARREATTQRLRTMGVRVARSLPPVVGEREVRLRSAPDVARRALALFVVAVRAESLAGDEGPIPVDDLRTRFPLALPALSPREAAFLENATPDRQDVVNATWRYEALQVLEWALGLVDELPFPDRICDVPRVARVIIDADHVRLADHTWLRPSGEVLDALDEHYRLHWAVRQAKLDGASEPANLEPGVVAERHHALNWLVRFEDADWDDVDTPT